MCDNNWPDIVLGAVREKILQGGVEDEGCHGNITGDRDLVGVIYLCPWLDQVTGDVDLRVVFKRKKGLNLVLRNGPHGEVISQDDVMMHDWGGGGRQNGWLNMLL